MISLRLKKIASLIDPEDKVADIGCDHAYLSIYLWQKKGCKTILASDINQNALEMAKKNIEKVHLEKEIPLLLSNGLEKINQKKIDTLIIAGMGAHTILEIVKQCTSSIKKIVVQSNNDLYTLRKTLKTYGFYAQKEEIVWEKGHYYVIDAYTREKRKTKKVEDYFGFYQEKNKEYYLYLWKEYQTILNKLTWKQARKKVKLSYQKHLLKKYL